MGSHLNGVDPRILTATKFVSTPHLVQPDLDESDLNKPGLYTEDIESAAIDVRDVSPATVARYDSAALVLKAAEEGPIATRVYMQVLKRYKCGTKRLDGSLCHETFAHKREVYQHQKTSARMRSVPCPFCEGRLRRPPGLLVHVQNLHPEKLWTDFRCRVCGIGGISTMVGLGLHIRRNHEGLSLEKRYNATRGF
jgi:hypothetical protein